MRFFPLSLGAAAFLLFPCPEAQAANAMYANAKDCGLPGVMMNCRVWEPANYKAATKYPLIVYLHGAGQAGFSSNTTENARIVENTQNWAGMLLGVVNEETGKTNGEYFVMMPQAPDSETKPPNGGAYVQWDWGQTQSYKLSATPESATLGNARAMLQGVQQKYSVDADRLYVIGSSMGGFGTWDLISRNPSIFAAGLPNAGGGPPDAAAALRNMAIWSHHNDGDGAVPAASDREMFKAVALAGGRPVYTETVLNDHTDGGVLGNRNFFSWMMAQRRGVAATSNPSLSFDPPGGKLTSPVKVTIASDQGKDIRYTLDGTVPSRSTGTVYKGPITIANSAILIAMVDSGEQKTFHAAPFVVDGKPLPNGAMIVDPPVPAGSGGSTGNGGSGGGAMNGGSGGSGGGAMIGANGGSGGTKPASSTGGQGGAKSENSGDGGSGSGGTTAEEQGSDDSKAGSGCSMGPRRPANLPILLGPFALACVARATRGKRRRPV